MARRLPCFESSHLEAVCRVLGDTSSGLTGSEIEQILREINVTDPTPSMTKWKRLFNALAGVQNERQVGNFLIQFINKALSPARYVTPPDLFAWRQDGLNVALAFAGYSVNDKGQVIHTTPESTVDGARGRATRLYSKLLITSPASAARASPQTHAHLRHDLH